MKFLLCWSKEEKRKINLQEESPCHRLHPFIFLKTAGGVSCPTATAPVRFIWLSGTSVRASWIWMSVFQRPRRRTPWTALCWRESWRLNCWQLSGSRTSRSWPLKLPQTGICPPKRCKADLKRCAPIWSWCRATLPCCMKCYKTEGYHAGKAV